MEVNIFSNTDLKLSKSIPSVIPSKGIPTVIHFMWYDKYNPNSNTYPGRYQKYVESWKKNHPNYTFRFWHNTEIKELWKLPVAQPFLDTYKKMLHIEKCDYTRYVIMHLYGGVYVDLNTKCYRSITPLLQNKEIAFIEEPSEHAERYGFDYLVTNSFLASVPNHPFWLDFMRYIQYHYWPSNSVGFVVMNSGPLALGRFIKRHYPNVSFIDTCIAQPFINVERGDNVVTKECISTFQDPNFPGPVIAKYWRDSAQWGQVPTRDMDSRGINDTIFFPVMIVLVLSILTFVGVNMRGQC